MSNNKLVSSSTSRVSIPNHLKKTVLNIQEIAKNHSEDDIYAMLLECSMDLNETVQRLLHLDTFHKVKSKRDKKNEVVKVRPGEDSRWKGSHYGRGTGGARGNTSSQYSSSDAGNWRSNFTRKDNGVEDNRDKGFKNPPALVLKKTDTVQPCHVEKALPISLNGPSKLPNGNLGGGHDSKPYLIDAEASAPVDSNLNKTESMRNNHSNQPDPQHVDESLPSSSMVEKEATILRELQAGEKSRVEASAHVDSSVSRTESISNNHSNQPDPQHVDESLPSSSMVEKESTILRELPSDVGSLAGVEEAASKQVNLKFVDGQNVIIPDHIQVPDAVKNMLCFGSINASFGVKVNHVKNDNIKNLHSTRDAAPYEATEISSSCDKNIVSPATQVEVEHQDNQQLQSHLPDGNHPIDTQVSSSANNDNQPKEDNLPAVSPPFPIVQTTPSYSFGFMPPVLANSLSQPERFESEAHVSSSPNGDSAAVSALSLTSPTQSTSLGQPQQIPFFHQPYPPNLIPYGHYFSPFYVPPTMHQYYGHTPFPSPIPTSNVFIPPSTAQVAMKTSPAHFKPGASAGNQAANGLPSGYTPNTAVTTGNLSTSADLMPTASKDNYIYSGQQAEGSAFWHPTLSRETANFPLNSFINFPPQGHHLISPQSSHGPFAVYHTMQPMPTPPSGLPLLHQSQPPTGQGSVGPPSNIYQQSQSQSQPQINWNL